jgi:hypothetical protein
MGMEQFENDGASYRGAMGGVIWTPEIADEVFKTWDYGHAFAYLFRRFGPAHRGCDPHKDLSSYWLTTRMKGVLLYVRPAHSVGTSFGYRLTMQINRKLYLEHTHSMWMEGKGKDVRQPRKSRIERALKQAMEELKRPTNVRDWLINIQGDVEGYPSNCVEPSNLAGYGITRDYFVKFSKDV